MGKPVKVKEPFEFVSLIGNHSADFIMGTGIYPENDAGYMDCIRFVNSKKTLTRGAGLYITYREIGESLWSRTAQSSTTRGFQWKIHKV